MPFTMPTFNKLYPMALTVLVAINLLKCCLHSICSLAEKNNSQTFSAERVSLISPFFCFYSGWLTPSRGP